MGKSTEGAAIYRKAAKMIAEEKEHAACWAINLAQSGGERRYGYSAMREAFEDLMLTDENGFAHHFGMWTDQDSRNERVLALCFMAEIVRSK